MRFKNLKLSLKIATLVLMSFAFLMGLSAYFILQNKQILLEDRKEKTEQLVAVGYSLIMKYHDLAASGQMSLEEAQDKAKGEIHALRYDETNYYFIFNTDLVMVMHPLKENLVGQSVRDYKDTQGKAHFVEMAEVAKKDGAGFVAYYWNNPKNNTDVPKLTYARLIPDWNWIVATGIYIDDVDAAFKENLKMSAVILIFVSFVLGLIAWLISRGIVNPLAKINAGVQSLAEDKVIKVEGLDRKDEVGDMARGLEYLNERMESARQLEKEQARLKVEAEQQRKQAMLDLADSFEQQVGNVIKSVIDEVHEMEKTSQAMTSLADETSAQATTVSSAATLASQNVQSVATATEELTASIREIAQQMQKTEESTRFASSSVSTTKDTMHKLTSTVEKVGSVADVIAGIAEQTNLLALNATIEAARAGDAGKGFAVVANEVKSLANETAKATQEITEIIKEVQSQTLATAEAVEKIAEVISAVSDATSSVSAAVEEQNSATGEIARSVQEASNGTGEVTRNITEVSAAASESGQAATELLGVARGMSEKSAMMQNEIKKFLANVRAS